MVISLYSLLTDASIQKKIEDEIAKYDADKLGMPDYALESSGESVFLMARLELIVYIYYKHFYLSGIFNTIFEDVCLSIQAVLLDFGTM